MVKTALFLSLFFCISFGAFAQTKPTMAVLYTKAGDESGEYENLPEVARFAFDQYNLIHKKKFEFNTLEIDDKGSGDVAQKELTKLLSTQKPLAIIGPLFSNVAMSLKPFVDQNMVPMISVFATHNDFTKDSKFAFRICAPNKLLVKTLADFLIPQIQKHKLSVSVFKDLSDSYSTDLADNFMNSLKSTKAPVNEVLFRGAQGVDRLKDINSKVWNPTNHDLLFLATQDLVAGKILVAMESEPYLLATVDSVNFMSTLKKIKKVKTHIRLISTDQWLPGKSKFSKTIEEAFRKKFKREMLDASALTFDAAYAAAAAYDVSQSKGIPLAQALREGTKVEGVTGNIALGPDGERIKATPFIKEDLIQ